MATKKVTITLPEEQLTRVRALIDEGRAASVSGFVQHAVAIALDDVAGWEAMLSESLAETGGSMTAAERAWADAALGVPGHQSSSAA